jgi:hypothetical protein
LDKITVRVDPAEIELNRRVQQSAQTVVAKATYKDLNKPAVALPLVAAFEKGAGNVFPNYKTDEKGQAKILLNQITSKDLEQTLGIKVDIDGLSGTSGSPIYKLIAATLNVPRAQVALKVQRPLVYLTADEKSFGQNKTNFQISNKLRNLLTNNGFEFTDEKKLADLWVDVKSDCEKGSVSGSIYITYLTTVIKVVTTKQSKEIYATTLDRIKGYGLDYDKSSIDGYNKSLETLEKERMTEFLNTVLQ